MNNPRKIFRELNDEKLNKVKTHPYFAELRQKIIERADKFLESDPPRIRFSHIHLFVTTGDRSTFQTDYFLHFERMNTMFLAYLITEEEKYLKLIEKYGLEDCREVTRMSRAEIDEQEETGRMEYVRKANNKL